MRNNIEIDEEDEDEDDSLDFRFSDDLINKDTIETDYKNLIWILEELDLITQTLNSNISKKQLHRLKEDCKILQYYFMVFEFSRNKQIAECCKTGLKQIYKFFPDLKSNPPKE